MISCSTDDDDEPKLLDQYLTANVNGTVFNSEKDLTSLHFKRAIGPAGRILLFVQAVSENGDKIEFLVENFNGNGTYYFGDKLYNNSWLKFVRISASEAWMLAPRAALNLTSNFIEITSYDDDLIEGRISCKELKSTLEDVFGAVDGEFRVNILP